MLGSKLRRTLVATSGAALAYVAAAPSSHADAASPPPPPPPAAATRGALPGERALNGPSILALLRAPHGLLSGLGLLEGHLLYATLRAAPGGLEQYDLLLAPDGASLRCLAVLGARACGHPRVVHGGALAAVLDDAFGALFLHCGAGSGFTANLSVDYVRPVPAGAQLEIRVRLVRAEPSSSGRSTKVYMEATVFERGRADAAGGAGDAGGAGGADGVAPGKVFARSTALFIAKKDTLANVAHSVTTGLWRALA